MKYLYYPNEGQKAQCETTSKYMPMTDTYLVYTKFILNGRGIQLVDVDDFGVNRYRCSEKAYNKLLNELDISEAMYLD